MLNHTLYRMTLRSRETKSLESACAEIVARAKNQGYETKGPVRIPTKILRITTRKSPCGEGSKTWDRFEMRIHKRVIDIHCPSSVVKEITNFRIDPGVDVNLVVWKQWRVSREWERHWSVGDGSVRLNFGLSSSVFNGDRFEWAYSSCYPACYLEFNWLLNN